MDDAVLSLYALQRSQARLVQALNVLESRVVDASSEETQEEFDRLIKLRYSGGERKRWLAALGGLFVAVPLAIAGWRYRRGFQDKLNELSDTAQFNFKAAKYKFNGGRGKQYVKANDFVPEQEIEDDELLDMQNELAELAPQVLAFDNRERARELEDTSRKLGQAGLAAKELKRLEDEKAAQEQKQRDEERDFAEIGRKQDLKLQLESDEVIRVKEQAAADEAAKLKREEEDRRRLEADREEKRKQRDVEIEQKRVEDGEAALAFELQQEQNEKERVLAEKKRLEEEKREEEAEKRRVEERRLAEQERQRIADEVERERLKKEHEAQMERERVEEKRKQEEQEEARLRDEEKRQEASEAERRRVAELDRREKEIAERSEKERVRLDEERKAEEKRKEEEEARRLELEQLKREQGEFQRQAQEREKLRREEERKRVADEELQKRQAAERAERLRLDEEKRQRDLEIAEQERARQAEIERKREEQIEKKRRRMEELQGRLQALRERAQSVSHEFQELGPGIEEKSRGEKRELLDRIYQEVRKDLAIPDQAEAADEEKIQESIASLSERLGGQLNARVQQGDALLSKLIEEMQVRVQEAEVANNPKAIADSQAIKSLKQQLAALKAEEETKETQKAALRSLTEESIAAKAQEDSLIGLEKDIAELERQRRLAQSSWDEYIRGKQAPLRDLGEIQAGRDALAGSRDELLGKVESSEATFQKGQQDLEDQASAIKELRGSVDRLRGQRDALVDSKSDLERHKRRLLEQQVARERLLQARAEATEDLRARLEEQGKSRDGFDQAAGVLEKENESQARQAQARFDEQKQRVDGLDQAINAILKDKQIDPQNASEPLDAVAARDLDIMRELQGDINDLHSQKDIAFDEKRVQRNHIGEMKARLAELKDDLEQGPNAFAEVDAIESRFQKAITARAALSKAKKAAGLGLSFLWSTVETQRKLLSAHQDQEAEWKRKLRGFQAKASAAETEYVNLAPAESDVEVEGLLASHSDLIHRARLRIHHRAAQAQLSVALEQSFRDHVPANAEGPMAAFLLQAALAEDHDRLSVQRVLALDRASQGYVHSVANCDVVVVPEVEKKEEVEPVRHGRGRVKLSSRRIRPTPEEQARLNRLAEKSRLDAQSEIDDLLARGLADEASELIALRTEAEIQRVDRVLSSAAEGPPTALDGTRPSAWHRGTLITATLKVAEGVFSPHAFVIVGQYGAQEFERWRALCVWSPPFIQTPVGAYTHDGVLFFETEADRAKAVAGLAPQLAGLTFSISVRSVMTVEERKVYEELRDAGEIFVSPPNVKMMVHPDAALPISEDVRFDLTMSVETCTGGLARDLFIMNSLLPVSSEQPLLLVAEEKNVLMTTVDGRIVSLRRTKYPKELLRAIQGNVMSGSASDLLEWEATDNTLWLQRSIKSRNPGLWEAAGLSENLLDGPIGSLQASLNKISLLVEEKGIMAQDFAAKSVHNLRALYSAAMTEIFQLTSSEQKTLLKVRFFSPEVPTMEAAAQSVLFVRDTVVRKMVIERIIQVSVVISNLVEGHILLSAAQLRGILAANKWPDWITTDAIPIVVEDNEIIPDRLSALNASLKNMGASILSATDLTEVKRGKLMSARVDQEIYNGYGFLEAFASIVLTATISKHISDASATSISKEADVAPEVSAAEGAAAVRSLYDQLLLSMVPQTMPVLTQRMLSRHRRTHPDGDDLFTKTLEALVAPQVRTALAKVIVENDLTSWSDSDLSFASGTLGEIAKFIGDETLPDALVKLDKGLAKLADPKSKPWSLVKAFTRDHNDKVHVNLAISDLAAMTVCEPATSQELVSAAHDGQSTATASGTL